jgi:ABC-2 type transport system ATP-binding protein
VIEVRGLTKQFGSTVAVSDLTFTVQPGRVTGFLGPNGSGKSTTMRCILGLDRPSAGECRVLGQPYAELDQPLRSVGALLDAGALHPNRKAVDHLRVIAASNAIPRSRVDEVLELVGLSSVAKQKCGGYSLGMKQRLGLAAAMLGDPAVLLFDEPVNGLDPEGIIWTREFLKYLAGQGRTVLVSSHLLTEMDLMADDLVVIGAGKLISSGGSKSFVAANSRQWVVVRSPHLDRLRPLLRGRVEVASDGALHAHDMSLADVGDLAGANGVTLHELSLHQSSLEDAFIEATRNDRQYVGQSVPPSVPNSSPPPPPSGPPNPTLLPPPGVQPGGPR